MHESSNNKIISNIGFEKQSIHCDVKQDYEQSYRIRLGSDPGIAFLLAKMLSYTSTLPSASSPVNETVIESPTRTGND